MWIRFSLFIINWIPVRFIFRFGRISKIKNAPMAAYEEVTTTCLICGPYVLIACKAFLVPLIAGSNNSFSTSVTLKWNGDAVCKKIVTSG